MNVRNSLFVAVSAFLLSGASYAAPNTLTGPATASVSAGGTTSLTYTASTIYSIPVTFTLNAPSALTYQSSTSFNGQACFNSVKNEASFTRNTPCSITFSYQAPQAINPPTQTLNLSLEGARGGAAASTVVTINGFTVAATSTDGQEKIAPPASVTVGYNAKPSFTVTSEKSGYFPTAGGTCPVGSWNGSVYTTGPVTSNCSVTFSLAISSYQVTPSGDGKESISPDTAQTVNYGSTQNFTVTPNTGYTLSPVAGTCPSGSWAGSTYTTGKITNACSVNFSATLNQYPITVTPPVNGTLICKPSANWGSSSTCRVTPATGYSLTALTDNGTNVLSQVVNGAYTLKNITTAHTLSATFSINTIAINTNAPANGTISCNPSSPNWKGTSTCTMTPSAGYSLTALTDNGVNVLNQVQTSGAYIFYTLSNVTKAHQINATFTINAYKITTTPVVNGTLICKPSANWGSSSTCRVTPAKGYSLTALTDNGTNVLSQVVNGAYTLKNITTAHTLSATFSINTIAITANTPSNGTISCTPSPVDWKGLSTCTMTAATGYSLTALTDNGTNVLSQVQTSGAYIFYTLSNVTKAHQINATFTINAYKITTTPVVNGTLICKPSANWGSSSTCRVTPATGYSLTALTDNGTNVLSQVVNGAYTLKNITTAHTLSATFSINTIAITANTPSNGTISCTPSPVDWKGLSTCTMTAATGYSLTALTDNGANVLSQVETSGNYSFYTLANVTKAHQINATFTINGYTVTPSGDNHEAISPSTAQTVNYGATQTFTVTPNTGYTTSSTVGGTCPAGSWAGNQYTTGKIVAACSVNFSASLNNYVVTPGGDGNEVITPNAPQTVNYGATQTFTVTPNTGYTTSSTVGGTCPAGSWAGNQYTTGKIVAACSVNFSASLNNYKVTPSGDGSEAISPNSPQTVNYNQSQKFSVTANTGYVLNNTVNDTCGAGGKWTNFSLTGKSTYQTAGVTGNCSVKFGAAVATLTSVSVAGPTSTPAGILSGAFTANGIYSDGSTKPLSSVTWTLTMDVHANGQSCDNSPTCFIPPNDGTTINAQGEVEGTQYTRTYYVWATYNKITNTVGGSLTVNPPVLSQVTVSPASPAAIFVGGTQQLTATCIYSDGTKPGCGNLITGWQSSNKALVTVSSQPPYTTATATAVNVWSAQISPTLSQQATVTPATVSVLPFTVAEPTVTYVPVVVNGAATYQATLTVKNITTATPLSSGSLMIHGMLGAISGSCSTGKLVPGGICHFVFTLNPQTDLPFPATVQSFQFALTDSENNLYTSPAINVSPISVMAYSTPVNPTNNASFMLVQGCPIPQVLKVMNLSGSAINITSALPGTNLNTPTFINNCDYALQPYTQQYGADTCSFSVLPGANTVSGNHDFITISGQASGQPVTSAVIKTAVEAEKQIPIFNLTTNSTGPQITDAIENAATDVKNLIPSSSYNETIISANPSCNMIELGTIASKTYVIWDPSPTPQSIGGLMRSTTPYAGQAQTILGNHVIGVQEKNASNAYAIGICTNFTNANTLTWFMPSQAGALNLGHDLSTYGNWFWTSTEIDQNDAAIVNVYASGSAGVGTQLHPKSSPDMIYCSRYVVY